MAAQVLLSLLLALHLQSAEGSLVGYALISGELPVRCVRVAAVPLDAKPAHFSETDSDGHFLFAAIPPGVYQVVILESAFDQPCAAVSVVGGRRSRIDLHLVRKAAPSGLHDWGNRETSMLLRLRAGRTYRQVVIRNPQ